MTPTTATTATTSRCPGCRTCRLHVRTPDDGLPRHWWPTVPCASCDRIVRVMPGVTDYLCLRCRAGSRSASTPAAPAAATTESIR